MHEQRFPFTCQPPTHKGRHRTGKCAPLHYVGPNGTADYRREGTNKPVAAAVKRSPAASVAEYEFQASDFFDASEEVFVREGGPKSEFGLLMKKVLTVVKEVNFAHTLQGRWLSLQALRPLADSLLPASF